MFKDLRERKKRDRQTEAQESNARAHNVFPSLDRNRSAIESIVLSSVDIVYYEFETIDGQKYLIVYMDDIINKEILDRDVIGGLISAAIAKQENRQDRRLHNAHKDEDKQPRAASQDPKLKMAEDLSQRSSITIAHLKSIIRFSNIKECTKFDEIATKLLTGDAIIFADGLNVALCLPSQGWIQRSIAEPDAEVITKGPREGFVETLKTNRSMIRRKLQNTKLRFEGLTLGTQTNTSVNIAYIDDIVNKDILVELKKRLQKIDIDGILDSAYVEELIRDEQFSPFNTVGYTERPDVVVAKLLEGRIAIMLDGTPIVLTVPLLFIENLQSNEDYYTSFVAASINRLLRFVSFLLSVFVPALYVALLTNHHEIIPSKLLFSFIAARQGVPFPTIIEVLIMIVLFELLRESGLRLPKGLGQTVSIVGALVLGQAAVEAKIISAPVVIVIAITAITSFIFYQINGAVMFTRFFVTILGAMFGLYGVTLGLIAIFIHMFSLQSFGIPYMSYIGSLKGQELKDTLIRAPWWYMYFRPRLISTRNYIRKGRAQKQ